MAGEGGVGMANFIGGILLMIIGFFLVLDSLLPPHLAREVGEHWGKQTRKAIGLPPIDKERP